MSDANPYNIARLLITSDGLNKEKIGEYLGSESASKVLEAYCS